MVSHGSCPMLCLRRLPLLHSSRQLLDRLTEALIARHVEQLIHDLLERRLINVVSDYPQHFADGLVGCCHCSISLLLFNANGSSCNPALGHRCRCGDQKWLGVPARYAARAQQVDSARTESANLCSSASPLHHCEVEVLIRSVQNGCCWSAISGPVCLDHVEMLPDGCNSVAPTIQVDAMVDYPACRAGALVSR